MTKPHSDLLEQGSVTVKVVLWLLIYGFASIFHLLCKKSHATNHLFGRRREIPVLVRPRVGYCVYFWDLSSEKEKINLSLNRCGEGLAE